MMGPDVVWYLCVSGFLFCTGALGVLIRRSPLIVLLSLEIMLNGSNLALIAFSRYHGSGDGPTQARPRRRPAQDAPRLIAAAWICLFSPLVAALAITVWGSRLTRRGAGYLASASVLVSFVAALVTFALLLGDKPDERSHYSTLWRWLTAGSF